MVRNTGQGQDYISYQKTINRADQDILKGNYYSALARLDSIYDNYSFIFARHCVKSLQISTRVHDSTRAKLWLQKAFVQGVPLWAIQLNEASNSCLEYPQVQAVLQNYKELRRQYYHQIDTALAREIDQLLERDQELTAKVNDGFVLTRFTWHYFKWRKHNKKAFKRITSITETRGFPSERLIGLPPTYGDTLTENSQNFILKNGLKPIDHRAYIMLIHYFSDKRKSINSLLLPQVKQGYLYAYQYGGLNDFMARWGKRKYRHHFYNVWHKDKNHGHLSEINKRRKAIGLNTYEQQLRNTSLLLQRRKSRELNEEVLLE